MARITRDQHQLIIQLFQDGKTMQELGDKFSVSRERIRQILNMYGLSGGDGGKCVSMRRERAVFKKRRDEKYLRKYGCTYDQFVSVCGSHGEMGRSPFYHFSRQRHSASFRGVEWKLTFWEWWTIWDESGKWEQRGRGYGCYCMCRAGDEGAYEVGNVYIDEHRENSSMGRTLAFERGVNKTSLYLVVQSAGGRSSVAEALGVKPEYVSQISNDDYLPMSWLEDGRAEKLADLTCGAYSLDDLAEIAESHQAKRGAA